MLHVNEVQISGVGQDILVFSIHTTFRHSGKLFAIHMIVSPTLHSGSWASLVVATGEC